VGASVEGLWGMGGDVKCGKGKSGRQKLEWLRKQRMIKYPWMADMMRRNAEFEKLAVAWSNAWVPLVKAFNDVAKKVSDDYAGILRLVNKTG